MKLKLIVSLATSETVKGADLPVGIIVTVDLLNLSELILILMSLAMVSDLDESVGQIMASLKKTGMLANSIVLFMSDNGAQTEGLLENFGSNYPLRGVIKLNILNERLNFCF